MLLPGTLEYGGINKIVDAMCQALFWVFCCICHSWISTVAFWNKWNLIFTNEETEIQTGWVTQSFSVSVRESKIVSYWGSHDKDQPVWTERAGKAYETYSTRVEEMKYKEGVEINVGVKGGCLPAESA